MTDAPLFSIDGRDPWREGARPRVTHLVLVDGLPADHWVEEGAEEGWPLPDAGRPRPPHALADPIPSDERELRWLEALVGGRQALLALTTEPWHERPVDTSAVPERLRGRAESIGAAFDGPARILRDPQLLPVLWRTWELVVRLDPGFLERSERDDTAVGAVCWIGASANGLLGPEGGMLTRDFWQQTGLPPSSASRAASPLARIQERSGLAATAARAASGPRGAPRLRATGHPELLTSATRAVIIARRDAVLARRTELPASSPLSPH